MSDCNAIASYSPATTFLSQIPQASDVPVNKSRLVDNIKYVHNL